MRTKLLKLKKNSINSFILGEIMGALGFQEKLSRFSVNEINGAILVKGIVVLNNNCKVIIK